MISRATPEIFTEVYTMVASSVAIEIPNSMPVEIFGIKIPITPPINAPIATTQPNTTTLKSFIVGSKEMIERSTSQELIREFTFTARKKVKKYKIYLLSNWEKAH